MSPVVEAPHRLSDAFARDLGQVRRPRLLVAADQNGTVHAFCQLLRHLDYTVDVVFGAEDALARILREESHHHLLVTGCGADGPGTPTVPAAGLVINLREVGYRGCIHLRSGFVAPEERGIYQRAAVGYVLTHVTGNPSFLDDVQALTVAAPADTACLSILQLGP